MSATKIEWTESTWNPLTGCTKISKGCKNCYAERMAKRLQSMRTKNYENGFKLTMHDHALTIPTAWKKPRVIFVNSMSDLFHKEVPLTFIKKVFSIMAMTPQHTYQVLTKRSSRLLELSSKLHWPKNVWMGVTVESGEYKHRIDNLQKVPAYLRFVSFEPLIAPIGECDLEGIDWSIVGGESGPNARPMEEEWVVEIKEQCDNKHVPFFFKQWGGTNKKKTGRLLMGKEWLAYPTAKTEVTATVY